MDNVPTETAPNGQMNDISYSYFTGYRCNQQALDFDKPEDTLDFEGHKEEDSLNLTTDTQNIDLLSSTKAVEKCKIDQEKKMRSCLVNVSETNHSSLCTDPTSKRRKSSVTMVALKRKLPDGDVPTETTCTGSSKRYLYNPRAGLLIPQSMEEKSAEGSWCRVSPSAFKLRGENFLRHDA